MQREYVRVAVAMDNGECRILSVLTLGKGSVLPRGATWENRELGWWRRNPTDAELLQEALQMYPAGVDSEGNPLPRPAQMRRVLLETLPSDRTYRDAWVDTQSGIIHDMVKARALHLDLVRHARALKLDALDREFNRATGQGKKTEADSIEAQRQALRDLPQTLDVDSARTVDDLKAKWSPDLD
jgi:hypothetical protein